MPDKKRVSNPQFLNAIIPIFAPYLYNKSLYKKELVYSLHHNT